MFCVVSRKVDCTAYLLLRWVTKQDETTQFQTQSFKWCVLLLALLPSWASIVQFNGSTCGTTSTKIGAQRDKQCALAVWRSQHFFAPPQTLFPGAQDGQNLISWRWSLPSPTDPVWWRSMHAISSYRGNRPTNKQINKHTNKRTHRHGRLQYTAPLSLARSVNIRGTGMRQ